MKHSTKLNNLRRLGLLLTAGTLAFLFTACNKDKHDHESSDPNPIELYRSNLPEKAFAELKDAQEATNRFRSIDSAVANGYEDIGVIVQNMGFHYMKASLADTLFDPKKPEILVYSKMHDGSIKLVAVEYAVPIPLMPDKAPEGFSGGADVWTYSTTFNLWLLHAWVWEYNPLGVFVPTNPNVHLH